MTSAIVDINPGDASKRRPVISLPTESLRITTAEGKLMNVASRVVQFKVKAIEKSDNGNAANQSIVTEMELINDAKSGLIASGNYELSFEKKCGLIEKMPSTPSWRTRFRSLMAMCNQIDEKLAKPSKLKFHLKWSKELTLEAENKENNGAAANGRSVFTRQRSSGSGWGRWSSFTKANESIQRFIYQFIHRNYRQKTEVWDKFKCPWCDGRFTGLYLLLKHLTLCHDYFKFKYVSSANEIRIDVLVNKKSLDLRRDAFSLFGTGFSSETPAKRKVATEIIVWRPDRYRPRLSEFFWNFDVTLYDRKRVFFHSMNGQVVRPSELDENSEDETAPRWLQDTMRRLMDDFIDVNSGEKEVMKLWNLHIMKHHYICNKQMFSAVQHFIDDCGEQILRENLYRNFMLHVCNLCGFGLLSAREAANCVRSLQRILVREEKIREIVFSRFREQSHFASKRKILVARRPSVPKPLTETPRRKTDLSRKRLSSLRCGVKNKVQRCIVATPNVAKKSAGNSN